MVLDAPYNQQSSGEIDLRELGLSLWRSKILILSVTTAIVCIAAAYAFLSTPIYEASARLLPPKVSDLASYNAASQLTGDAVTSVVGASASRPGGLGIQELTPKAAYDAFLQHLNSDSVKQEFFEKYYVITNAHNNTNEEKERLWKRFNKELEVKPPQKSGDVVTIVTIEGVNAQTVADWTNRYVNIAATKTQKDLIRNLASEVGIRNKSISDQIAALRSVARTQRMARIERVENALTIAKSIGLEAPPAGSPLIAIGNTNANDLESFANGAMMYLRGTKALQSELELLKTRKSDNAYIPELSNLLVKQSLLDSINLNPEHFAVVDVDRAATALEEPTKPRKILILALGIILGGVLGILAAIIRNIFG